MISQPGYPNLKLNISILNSIVVGEMCRKEKMNLIGQIHVILIVNYDISYNALFLHKCILKFEIPRSFEKCTAKQLMLLQEIKDIFSHLRKPILAFVLRKQLYTYLYNNDKYNLYHSLNVNMNFPIFFSLLISSAQKIRVFSQKTKTNMRHGRDD